MVRRPDVSLVLPCYNEAEHLERSVLELVRTLQRFTYTFELIFVEDASRDDTLTILHSILGEGLPYPSRVIAHDNNQGRGRTASDGLAEATGTYAGFIDIDLEVHPRYIPACITELERGAAVAMVRRIYPLKLKHMHRIILSRGYAALVKVALNLPKLDTESGFKFFRTDVLPQLLAGARDPGWFWDTEVIVKALEHGLKVAEVPGVFLKDDNKTSTVRIVRDTLMYLDAVRRMRGGVRQDLSQKDGAVESHP